MADHTGEVFDATDLDGPTLDVLVRVWSAVLNLPDLDPDIGFFDLGADSTNIPTVAEILRVRWPDLRIIDLFAWPTARQLAEYLDR